MSDPRPIDAFLDRFPYRWRWSRDFALSVQGWLDILDNVYELIDPWTYENHWWHVSDPADPRHPWIVDLYWGGQAYVRSQMPPDQGDEIAAFIVENMSQHLRCIIWNHRIWRPTLGWVGWSGVQGDFVDHIHLEFDSEGITNA